MLTGSKGLGELVTPFAVQQTDVHFRRQRRGIKFFDHLHRRAGVARQGQQIDVAAKNQPECDGRVSQAEKLRSAPCGPALMPSEFKIQLNNQPMVLRQRRRFFSSGKNT